MSDDFRDERGRLKKGAPPLFKGKQVQPTQDQPPDQDIPSPDFDAAIIKAVHSHGSGLKPKIGLDGYLASLMASRPVEFAALLSKALARKAEAATNPAAYIPITVEILPCPANFFVPADQAKAAWEKRAGLKLSDNNELPPVKPVLVAPSDKPSAPELDDNEIMFGGVDDDEADEADEAG